MSTKPVIRSDEDDAKLAQDDAHEASPALVSDYPRSTGHKDNDRLEFVPEEGMRTRIRTKTLRVLARVDRSDLLLLLGILTILPILGKIQIQQVAWI